MNKPQGRKALIILSDGVDQGSKVSLNRAIEAAQRADTLVYTILFADPQAYNNLARHAGYPGGGYPGGGYPGRHGGGYPGGGYPGGGYPGGGGGGGGGTVAAVTAAADDRRAAAPTASRSCSG